MKRIWIFCIMILLVIIISGLFQTAIDPKNFTGQWYSSQNQSAYLFEDGLIHSAKHSAGLSDADSIIGAYSFCRDSVFLFVSGMDGLEKEKEIFLVHNGDGSFLCENKDGSGTIYFIRYNQS